MARMRMVCQVCGEEPEKGKRHICGTQKVNGLQGNDLNGSLRGLDLARRGGASSSSTVCASIASLVSKNPALWRSPKALVRCRGEEFVAAVLAVAAGSAGWHRDPKRELVYALNFKVADEAARALQGFWRRETLARKERRQLLALPSPSATEVQAVTSSKHSPPSRTKSNPRPTGARSVPMNPIQALKLRKLQQEREKEAEAAEARSTRTEDRGMANTTLPFLDPLSVDERAPGDPSPSPATYVDPLDDPALLAQRPYLAPPPEQTKRVPGSFFHGMEALEESQPTQDWEAENLTLQQAWEVVAQAPPVTNEDPRSRRRSNPMTSPAGGDQVAAVADDRTPTPRRSTRTCPQPPLQPHPRSGHPTQAPMQQTDHADPLEDFPKKIEVRSAPSTLHVWRPQGSNQTDKQPNSATDRLRERLKCREAGGVAGTSSRLRNASADMVDSSGWKERIEMRNRSAKEEKLEEDQHKQKVSERSCARNDAMRRVMARQAQRQQDVVELEA